MKLLSYITILCAPIFTLFFFSSYREEKPLYIGGLCCFIAIIAISIIMGRKKDKQTSLLWFDNMQLYMVDS